MCGHSAGRGGSKFWVSGMTARGESHVLDHVVRISSGGSRGLIFGRGPGFLPSSLVESRKPPSPKQGPCCGARPGLTPSKWASVSGPFTDSQATLFRTWKVTSGSAPPLWLVHKPV